MKTCNTCGVEMTGQQKYTNCKLHRKGRKENRVPARTEGQLMRCFACGRELPPEQMVLDKRAIERGWRSGECKACKRTRSAVSQPSREQQRAYHLQAKYGITTEEEAAMLQRQNGVCAICKRPRKKVRLHIDHDHETGLVRGILCARCNSALEWFIDYGALIPAYLSPEINSRT